LIRDIPLHAREEYPEMKEREMAMQDAGGLEAVDEDLCGLRRMLNSLLFDYSHPVGRAFNVCMWIMIVLAVLASMLDTVPAVHARWSRELIMFQHQALVLFAAEYALRVYAARSRWGYVKSFNGLVDLMTVLPLFIAGQSYTAVRLLRLARIIRVAVSVPVVRALFASLAGSGRLLGGVLGTISLISILAGNIIYIIEPQTFANAFEGAWWSLVTMSTVGYGDFVPDTAAGKAIASLLIMSGICMFAMVTAVISVRVGRMVNNNRRCHGCAEAIAQDFLFCPHCGAEQPWRRDNLLEPDEV